MSVTGYVIENGIPRCPTEVCNAVCCRATHFRPDRPPPCEYLTAKNTCELHDVGGRACKPVGCADYPNNQADIDMINKQAEQNGFSERCQLRFE
jgi:hypothetical protein